MKQLYTMSILLLMGFGTVGYSSEDIIQPFGKITWDDTKLDVLKKICEIESVNVISINNKEQDKYTICNDINISLFEGLYYVEESKKINDDEYARSYKLSIVASPIVINHLDFEIKFSFQTDEDYMATNYMNKEEPIIITTPEYSYFAYEHLMGVSLHSSGSHDDETYKVHMPIIEKALIAKYKHLKLEKRYDGNYKWSSPYNSLSAEFEFSSVDIKYNPVEYSGEEGKYLQLVKELDGSDKGLLDSL